MSDGTRERMNLAASSVRLFRVSIPFSDRRLFRLLTRDSAHFHPTLNACGRSQGAKKRKRPARHDRLTVVNQVVCVGHAAGGRCPTVSLLKHRFHNAGTPQLDILKENPVHPFAVEKERMGTCDEGETREPSITIRFACNYIHIC